MKTILTIIISVSLFGSAPAQQPPMTSFYDFTVTTIDGKEFKMSSLKGKKVLIVNTASECGNTPQYADLQKLYEKYKDKNFVIVGFPANEFGKQEPGTNSEIQTFCKKNYGVTFPMMGKVVVKAEGICPLYKWLTEKTGNGVADVPVKWNFQKFMIDENGKWVDFVKPGDSPICDKIINWIEGK